MFNIIQKKYIVVISIIFIIGCIFRFYNLGSQSYWIDEAITVLNVQSIQETGAARNAAGSYYSCPLYCYPTSLIADTFGNNPISYRVLATIFGSLFILLIFYISRRMFDTRVALLTAFFTAFSYWQITWSRQARWYTLFECLFWLSTFLFYLALTTKKKVFYYITLLLLPLTILAHSLGYLLPIIFAILYLVNQIHSKEISWRKVLILLTSLVGIYFIADYIFHLNKFGSLGNDLGFRWLFPQNINFYVRNYWLFFIFSTVALIFAKKSNNRGVWYLATIFSSYFFVLSLFSRRLNYGHFFHITPIFYILGSIGIVIAMDKIKNVWIKAIFLGTILVIFLASHGGVLVPKTNYFLESDDPYAWPRVALSYSTTMQPNWTSAYEFVLSKKQPADIVISSTPQFNKLFLGEPQYWLSWLPRNSNFERNGKDIYVGATALHDVYELNKVISQNHGYIIFEGFYRRPTFSSDILSYIKNLDGVFYEETGNSIVWVYKF